MAQHERSFIIALVCFFIGSAACLAQSDTAAFNYKLSYDVPESPAFSVLNANPNTVMRGSAAQELVINIANNFISNSRQAPGIAADFNPYFVFGGRLKNINEYRDDYFLRLLANTQLSIATVADKNNPDDLLGAVGLRFTLFDNNDLLQNEALGQLIDNALMPQVTPNVPGSAPSDEIVSNPLLTQVYAQVKEKMKNSVGGAVSVGLATAIRMNDGVLASDSVFVNRNQLWIAGQYNFGNGLYLMATGMYRNNMMDEMDDINEVIAGVGVRYIGKKVNVGSELSYNSEMGGLEFSSNIEVEITKQLWLYASIGNRSDVAGGDDLRRLEVRPGIKWNLSEIKR